MGTELQQVLRSFCFDTEWKYAVFWKLKHQARMVLTLEDAYYDNYGQHDPLENKFLGETMDHKFDGHPSHDSLGLAVAKMSYHVYSLGEGIVGQVAAIGKHEWVFADNFAPTSCSTMEYYDRWQTQFSAGIKTIAVVSVIPHGVVQLGSLNKVVENLKLVDHIRDVFSAFQNSPAGHIDSSTLYHSSLDMPNISSRNSVLGIPHDSLQSLDKAVNKEQPNVLSAMFPAADKFSVGSCVFPLPDIHQNMAVEIPNKLGGPAFPTPMCEESTKLVKRKSENASSEQSRPELLNQSNCEENTSVISKLNDSLWSHSIHEDNLLCNVSFLANSNRTPLPYFHSEYSESVTCDRFKFDDHSVASYHHQVSQILESSDTQPQKESSNKLDNQTDLSYSDSSNVSFKFSAGCELFEALGPAFSKHSGDYDGELLKAKAVTTIELPDGLSSSQSTSESGAEHLLEAVVANICAKSTDAISERLFHQSMRSLLTTEDLPESSGNTKQSTWSVNPSICQPSFREENIKNRLSSSETCFLRSPTGFSSTCISTCSEPVEKSSEPIKTNKKRARPGESCRPRPRDRQLIQDRIKELRELVPSGSKCSIDSLLERTIKHMLFLQSITKHADKLNKCAESKMRNKETSIRGSSGQEQGSSWAVEVGSHLKVCTIIVENVNMNGQMLVEMLCDECSHFLEIAEAIRSLGLTILKGVTEACGEKTWICFVVEGQNNRSMHRMDILWSLVNILQPKNVV